MPFDINSALKDGYTPTQIADFLGSKQGFDVATARKDGYSDNQILDFLTKSKTAGMGEALAGSTKRLLSSTKTALTAPFGADEAAVQGLERQQAITQRPGASLDEVKRVYEQEGFFPAAKEAISQIPGAITEQVPVIGEMIAGARAGAMLPVPPQFRPITALGGAALGPFLSQTGTNIERQAAEQITQGKPVDVSLGKAFGAGAGQAALDVVSLRLGLGRLLGVSEKAVGTAAAESKLKSALLGTGKTALAEVPTEVTQQMFERAQAGLPLTNDEALKEYADAGYQAALMSPLGGATRIYEASEARQSEDKLIKDEQKRIAATQAEAVKTRAEAERAYAQATADQQALINAQIKAAPERSLIDIVNEVTGVSREPVGVSRQSFVKAWNEPSGQRVADSDTGLERELSMGEYHAMQNPDLFTEEAKQVLALPPAEQPALIVFPDNSVGTEADAKAYIESLPEDQQITARAKLYGYEPQKAEPVELAKPPVLGLPSYAGETMVSFPDGSLGTQEQAKSYIQSFPEPERNDVRASLLGYEIEAAPTKLDKATLTSLVPNLTPQAGIYKRLLKLDNIDSEEKLVKLRGELSKLGDNYAVNETKLKEIEDAYTATAEREAAKSPTAQFGRETVGAGVQDIGGLGRGVADTSRVARPDIGRMDVAGSPVSEPLGGTSGKPPALEAPVAPKDFIKSIYDETPVNPFNNKQHGFVYDNGDKVAFFELKPSSVLKGATEVDWISATPQRTGVGTRAMKDLQAKAQENNIPLTLVPWDKGNVSKKSLTDFYTKLGFKPLSDTSKTLVWYPSKPAVETAVEKLNPYQQRIAEQRRAEEQARLEEKAANLAAAKAEQAAIAAQQATAEQRATKARKVEEAQAQYDDAIQAAQEELPTVDERAAEPDVDEEAFKRATDTLGAFARQRIGGVKNITPEEQISTAQALAALGDIMYYIVKKGVKSAGQAINQARRALGNNAKYISSEEFQAAYDQAMTRVKETPPTPAYVKPEGDLFDQTAEFMPPEAGKKDSVVDMVKNFDRSVINTENVNKFVNNARINVVYSGAGIADELTRAYEGAVSNALTKEVRADILMSQALSSNKLGAESAMDGKIVFDDNGVAKVVDDPNNLNNVFASLASLSEKIGADKARHAAQAYLVGLRYQSWLALNAKKDLEIAAARKAGKRGLADKIERQKKYVSEAQEAAIPAALQFGEIYPEVKDIAAKYDASKNNEIDMLEQAGYYSKELADEYRATKGYVPLYRIMDDIEDSAPGAKQYFRGFADIGAEKKATGSERQVDDVFDNMMTRHMWAVNAAVRNRANRAVANQLGIVNKDGVLIVTDKIQPGAEANSAPVWINGERKYVQYSDPAFAQGIQGLEPALGPIMSILAGASKIMRMGITMLPPFQLAMVFQDAPRAALNSGVERPFQVMGKVVSSFAQILKDPNDPFVVEMRRLGITGGYGHNAKEVASKLRRDLGLESNSMLQKALDKAETFAAASDLAQRRAIYMQTMEETNNPVLAMHRALDIINFQKHGRSAKIRALTQVIPFMNAYLQGMDVLYQAMSGKGISGKEKRQAQMLFVQTAIKLAALSALYSMLVADDEDYQKLDDRQKVRSLIIPGTGIKIPVAADVAMLVKAIPELGYQYIVRDGTKNPMDATKLFQGISQSIIDGISGPNLMPQALRAGVEVAVNRNFLTGNPIIGRGLETLATEEQFTENTSRLARLIGQTGIMSPMNADHLIKGYGGTTASLFLYSTDALVNQVADVKTPSVPVYRIPSISSFLYSTEGKGQLNDYYDLKEKSDEVTATLTKKMKYGTDEEAREYREDNKEMLSVRGRVNAMSNQMKTLREQRKRIIASDLDASTKRERLDEIDGRIAKVVEQIGAVRVKAGL